MQQIDSIIPLRSVTKTCKLCHAKDLCIASSVAGNERSKFEDIVGHRSAMRRGERLYMAGDSISSIYILHSGSVKTYVESSDGDNQITGFHLPGDVIGIHGVENMVHSDTVETLETSSVCEIRFTEYDSLIDTFPSLHTPLMNLVFRELSHEQEMLLVLGKMSADRRVAHFLLDLSKRMAEHGLSDRKINLTMTRHDIGNYLSLAVETVSRILTRFQTIGAIDVDRRFITILNNSRLESIFNNAKFDDKTNDMICS